jgi:hypothetical protein
VGTVVGVIVEPYATVLIIGARAVGAGGTADDNLGGNIAGVLHGGNVAGLMRSVCKEALLLVVSMAVAVAMLMFMVMVVIVAISRAVRVAVAAEDEETDEVGEKTGASNSENELGAVDLRGLDESGEGLENDGNAKCDEEDSVEEGTKNFGANPLHIQVSKELQRRGGSRRFRRTPKVNSSVVSFCAATTAHRPMIREIISLSYRREEYISQSCSAPCSSAVENGRG